MSVITSTLVEASSAPLINPVPAKTVTNSPHQDISSETIVHQDSHVYVSTQRLVVGIKSFELDSIKAAHVRRLPIRKGPILLLLIGAAAVGGWLLISWSLIAMLVLCAIGLAMLGLIRAIRPNYVLRVTTGSGESDVLMSADRVFIDRAYKAITEVIAKP